MMHLYVAGTRASSVPRGDGVWAEQDERRLAQKKSGADGKAITASTAITQLRIYNVLFDSPLNGRKNDVQNEGRWTPIRSSPNLGGVARRLAAGAA